MYKDASIVVIAALAALAFASSTALAQRNLVDWEALLASFEPQIREAFPTNEQHRRDIRVYCTADVTGDGVDESVIMLGIGGVSTEAMALLHLQNGEPAIARWRRRDGNIDRAEVLKGGSVTYTADFELRPQDRAISNVECRMASNPNVPETAACTAYSYVWNGQDELFEYDGVLSERVAREYFQRQRERETSKHFPLRSDPKPKRECGE